jgi:hypothetical protein
MDMPPTRFRVVERDRRLVVIDTHAGEVASPVVPPATGARATTSPTTWRDAAALAGITLPKQTRFDGTTTLTTAAWYDDKGPRTVTLDPGAVQMAKIGGGSALVAWIVIGVLAPALFFTPLTLLLPGVAKPLRERLTGWLDRYADQSLQSSPVREVAAEG